MLILQGPNHPVEALTFAPDSTAVYAVQGHHGIRAWNLADRTATRAEADGRLLVASFVFHPGGRWAFSRTAHTRPPDYNGALAIDLTSGAAKPFDSDGPRDTIAFHPNGGIVSIGGYRLEWGGEPGVWHHFSRLCWWDLTANGPELVRQREFAADENLLLVAALGDRLATAESLGSRDDGEQEEQTHRVTIRRWSDGEPQQQLTVPRPTIQQLLASQDGTVLATRSGAELHIWDATDWTRPPIVPPAFWNVTQESGACFHPSGRFLLFANDTSSAVLFDTLTWQQVQSWKWGIGRLRSVAVSPDGTLAAAGSNTGAIVVWDLDL